MCPYNTFPFYIYCSHGNFNSISFQTIATCFTVNVYNFMFFNDISEQLTKIKTQWSFCPSGGKNFGSTVHESRALKSHAMALNARLAHSDAFSCWNKHFSCIDPRDVQKVSSEAEKSSCQQPSRTCSTNVYITWNMVHIVPKTSIEEEMPFQRLNPHKCTPPSSWNALISDIELKCRKWHFRRLPF